MIKPVREHDKNYIVHITSCTWGSILPGLFGFPKFNLFRKPTVLEKAENLSDEVGVEIYVKRDDAIEFAMGGNKVRKLEYIIGDALAKKSDTLVTVGAIHSNHARTTVAATRKAGLNAHLILWPKNYSVKGNLLLDILYGAEITFVSDKNEAKKSLDKIAEELKKRGKKPYIIPLGGAIPIGVLGYIEASFELAQQFREFSINPKYIVHASGSGGTHAGLILGMKLLKLNVKVLGINIIGNSELKHKTFNLAKKTSKTLGLNVEVKPQDVIVYNYDFGGYGVINKEVVEIMAKIARTEGLLLDPVYTAKAMAGLLDLIRRGYIEKNSQVVFIHTGGYPIIFQYDNEIKQYLS